MTEYLRIVIIDVHPFKENREWWTDEVGFITSLTSYTRSIKIRTNTIIVYIKLLYSYKAFYTHD